jgi:plasmid stability protein
MMRTTLTLDDDVAAALARRRVERGTGLRQEVNELLRAGLAVTSRPSPDEGEAYELPTFDPGRPLITDHRAMKDLLDDEDIERALPRRP